MLTTRLVLVGGVAFVLVAHEFQHLSSHIHTHYLADAVLDVRPSAPVTGALVGQPSSTLSTVTWNNGNW